MIKYTKTIILVFNLFSICFAQVEVKDSIKNETSPQSLDVFISKFDEFDFYRQLNSMRMNVPLNYDTNTVWLWTLFALSKPEFGKKEFGTPGNISQFLYDDYIRESKFNPVKYVLGMAEVGAVGYLAYRHIKKYGFMK